MRTPAFVFMLAASTTACSTPYKKTLLATGAGVLAGSAYGMSRDDFKNQNATLYGSLGGLIAGATALALNADEQNDPKLQAENQKLKEKLNEFERRLEPKLVGQGSSLFNSPLPKEVAGLVEPGEWRKYKMDQWVQDPNDSNIWIRQVEMFEIVPPSPK